MASYQEIKNYVLEKHGYRVKSGWIAHAKEVYKIPVKRAPNRNNLIISYSDLRPDIGTRVDADPRNHDITVCGQMN